MDKKQIEILLRKIAKGDISVIRLPKNLYYAIADELEKSMYKGYGKSLSDVKKGTIEFVNLSELKKNALRFSAAKVFQQVRDFEAIKGTKDFYEIGAGLFDKYNKTWLDVEKHYAQRVSRAVKNWEEHEAVRDVKPLLKYQTVGDARVRPEHVALDNTVKPIDDPFWDSYNPPWDYRCRCIAISVSDEKITKNPPTPKVDKVFAGNPAKEKFNMKNHPYYKVPKKYKDLKDRNFDLPL